MNAYELADKLDLEPYGIYGEQAANMLRQLQKEKEQQADRIERLEAEARAKNNYLEQHCQKIDQQADRIAELEKCIEFGYKDAMDIVVLNNLGAEDNHWFVWAKKLVNIDYTAPKPIEKPLYTTPQTKPLSDETFTTDLSESWIACGGCGERVTGDVKHHCKSKPLSDEEINNLYVNACVTDSNEIIKRFARAIEERHGIK